MASITDELTRVDIIPERKEKRHKPNKMAQIEAFLFDRYDIRYNTVSGQYQAREKGTKNPYELMEEDSLKYELFDSGHTGFKEYFSVLMAAKVPRFDPIIEYFENLPKYDPDRDPDYIDFLANFVLTDDDAYFKQIFRKILIWVAAQAIEKVPFNKYCLTLIGEQNDGKTSFLNFLVPYKLKDYYKSGFNFENKDGQISLIQNFIINLDELASFDKKEINSKFKAVLSESSVKFRPPYATKEIPHPRRASFVASTNQYEFLTDETGNVRWFVFPVKRILHDNGGKNGYNRLVNIDNVWSQVYHLLQTDFNFNFTPAELEKQRERNIGFLAGFDELHYVKTYVSPVLNKDDPDAEFLNSTQIADRLRSLAANLKINTNSTGKALRALGFKQETRRVQNHPFPVKGYLVKIKSSE